MLGHGKRPLVAPSRAQTPTRKRATKGPKCARRLYGLRGGERPIDEAETRAPARAGLDDRKAGASFSSAATWSARRLATITHCLLSLQCISGWPVNPKGGRACSHTRARKHTISLLHTRTHTTHTHTHKHVCARAQKGHARPHKTRKHALAWVAHNTRADANTRASTDTEARHQTPQVRTTPLRPARGADAVYLPR